MVSFALVQLSKKHTEIFGSFLEIFIKNEWDFYIYYDKDDDNYTFVNYYQKLFNTKFNIRAGKELMEYKNAHDFYIFTSSADDVRMDEYFKQPSMANKCIFVNHQAPHWKPYMHKNILMSPVIKSSELDKEQCATIVPIYREYKKLHSNPNQTIIAIVGAIHKQAKDINLLKDVLEKHAGKDFTFYIFMRRMDWKAVVQTNAFLKNNPHIQVHSGLTTEKMMEKLKEVKFIWPLSKQGGWFYWQRLTGAIPLAINLNMPLVIDKKLAKIYDMESCCILYNKQLSEIMDEIIQLPKDKYFNLIENAVIYKKLIAKRNTKEFVNLCLSQVEMQEKNDLKIFQYLNSI